MGNQYDLEQAQDRLNRIYIGNLESYLLAREGWGGGGGSPIALRAGQSEVKGKKRASVSYYIYSLA